MSMSATRIPGRMPELVEQGRGVDAFHGRYRATHAARVRASLRDLRLRPGAPADAAAVRPRRSTCCARSGPSRVSPRSRRPTRSCVVPHRGATSRSSSGSRRSRSAGPRPGIGEGGDDPPFAGMHEAGAMVAGGSLRGDRGDPPRRRRACLPPGRRAPSRDARPRVRVLHLRRSRPWPSPGRAATACASCTSTWTSTTATASRRSTGTTRAS